MIQRFVDVAMTRPDHTAVEWSGEATSYGALLADAERIARQLGELPSRRPGRIALLFEDRRWAIASILGVLKAGHAFVSLDPLDPDARLDRILRDCRPLALLSDAASGPRRPRLAAGRMATLDVESPRGGFEPEDRRRRKHRRRAGANRPGMAYVFYTSGSTGEPKGVCQTQANLAFFVDAYARTLGIGADDRVSLLYSLGFSAANMDVFGSLLAGATLCAYDLRRDGIPGLRGWIDEARITVLHMVPTVFRRLVAGLDADRVFRTVHAIDLGGETVTGQDVERARRHFVSSTRLVNHLAATEASVIAQHVARDADIDGVVPAGVPPAGLEVRLEGPDGRAAKPGETGRLVVLSPHVSPGYWRRPALDRAHFGSDSRPGWRVFRTEDLGRFDDAGLLHFVGRIGTRVKVRGHTVDLAEVEAALRGCDGVLEAAVVQSARGPDRERSLVAHVVLGPDAVRDPIALRDALAARLPPYMLPQAIAFPARLPTTSSGKVDRQALASVGIETRPESTELPDDPLEREIVEACEQVLGRRLAVGDDFFLSGGDSLSAVELQLFLSTLVGRTFPLRALLRDATIAGLASAVRRLRQRAAETDEHPLLVPLREAGSLAPLFLVHGRLGQAHVGPDFLSRIDTNRPVFALQARGLEPDASPHATIDAMAADYVDAIRRVRPQGPYVLGGLCAGGYVALAMAERLQEAGERVLPLLLIDPPPPPLELSPEERREAESPEGMALLAYVKRRNLYHLEASGKIDYPLEARDQIEAGVRVAVAFEQALASHVVAPSPARAEIVVSDQLGGPDGWGDPDKRRWCFSVPPRVVTVARRHLGVLEVGNDDFARAVAGWEARLEAAGDDAEAGSVGA